MHTIDLDKFNCRTDLIIEKLDSNFSSFKHEENDNIVVDRVVVDGKREENYVTISFSDITDKDNYKKVQETFILEFKKFLEKYNLKKEKIMVVGLGNSYSTPDALGPEVISNILVTRHLFELGDVQDGYVNVCSMSPGVIGTTGVETISFIKGLIKEVSISFLIIIDALASSSVDRVNKTIQITDSGINPGSGIGNDRGEISYESLGIPVIAIGVPTVVDAATIVKETLEKLDDYSNKRIDEILSNDGYDTFIVTPKEIDFLIEKFGTLLGGGINKSLHQAFNSTE